MAERARVSLVAELRRREALLARAGVGSLRELVARDPEGAPPALLIVVDEFATLVREVPAFVDTVVDLTQRGRSLGLHLVLATQRPRGAVSDAIRANANLRIAMRMGDKADSADIIDSDEAAEIPAATPGRALALTGRRAGGEPELTTFQAAYASGRSTAVSSATVTVADLRLGQTDGTPEVVHTLAGHQQPTDLQVLVQAAAGAAKREDVPRPRSPYLPPLPALVDLAAIEAPEAPDRAVVGLLDEPARQRRSTLTFDPDTDGSLLVFGAGGSGKTTLLRTVAVSLAQRNPVRELHLYGVDVASRGLQSLEGLPALRQRHPR